MGSTTETGGTPARGGLPTAFPEDAGRCDRTWPRSRPYRFAGPAARRLPRLQGTPAPGRPSLRPAPERSGVAVPTPGRPGVPNRFRTRAGAREAGVGRGPSRLRPGPEPSGLAVRGPSYSGSIPGDALPGSGYRYRVLREDGPALSECRQLELLDQLARRVARLSQPPHHRGGPGGGPLPARPRLEGDRVRRWPTWRCATTPSRGRSSNNWPPRGHGLRDWRSSSRRRSSGRLAGAARRIPPAQGGSRGRTRPQDRGIPRQAPERGSDTDTRWRRRCHLGRCWST